MKPGDLVVGKPPDGLARNSASFRPVAGILLERIHMRSPNKWWRVLCDDGLVVEETEQYMSVLIGDP